MNWPEGKDFAFTIVDDTDRATVETVKPVYDLLQELNILTTKTVWVYPPRDKYRGQSLLDPEYYHFIKDISDKGFEIALHNVGSGNFSRAEIEQGLELFNKTIGFFPRIHINHASNIDNVYWGYERYTFPLRNIMKAFNRGKRSGYGTDEKADCFWGDLNKRYIRYIRNRCFNSINTLAYDPLMPYKEKSKEKYSNYWFSSSDGQTVTQFTELIGEDHVDLLARDHGACIIYTHFADGFVDPEGRVDARFAQRMEYLSKKKGWFVPAGQLLDYLLACKENDQYTAYTYQLRLDLLWIMDRINKWRRYGR